MATPVRTTALSAASTSSDRRGRRLAVAATVGGRLGRQGRRRGELRILIEHRALERPELRPGLEAEIVDRGLSSRPIRG